MSKAGIYTSGKTAWRCDKCGTVSPWSSSWRWYGAWVNKKTKEEPYIERTYCSEKCSGPVELLP